MAGRSIRIFLTDGTPTGVRTMELGMSSIKGVFAPRTALDALAKREEAHRTGIYVLVGEDPEVPGRPAVYVGEGDDVLERIVKHDKDTAKDFWDRVALFVSKDGNVTKAHARWLEARLIYLAAAAKRATLMNKTNAVGGLLPEADEAEMEEFLEQLRLLLATVGVSAFEVSSAAPATEGVGSGKAPLLLEYSGQNYSAQAVLLNDEFVVKRDSLAKKSEAPSLSPSSRALRKSLQEAGVLLLEGESFRFTQDYSFSSASGSAQVICGANVSGKVVWRVKGEGLSYGAWLEKQMEKTEVKS